MDVNVNKSSGSSFFTLLKFAVSFVQFTDWIAHGILDSVVDSFIPFLYEIEKEAGKVEDEVFANDIGKRKLFNQCVIPDEAGDSQEHYLTRKKVEGTDISSVDEKSSFVMEPSSVKTRFCLSSETISIYLRRVKRMIHLPSKVPTPNGKKKARVSSSSALTIHRMARTRRLVTTLTRLLATKSDLIAQIRKRLMSKGEWTLGSDPELYIHMGDIIGLLSALFDCLLNLVSWCFGRSHSDSTARTHSLREDSERFALDISSSTANVGMDDKGWCQQSSNNSHHCEYKHPEHTDRDWYVVCMYEHSGYADACLLGLCSLNVTLPTNGSRPTDRYDIFGIVLGIVIVILSGFVSTVRYMWLRAGRKMRVF
jgi:magnesium transporter